MLIGELAERAGTSPRTLRYYEEHGLVRPRRDVNGYRLGPGYRGQRHELPGLWFSERELYSLLMANQLLGEIDAPGMLGRHLQPLVERIHQMLGTGEADAKTLLKRVRIISPAKRPVPSRWFELVGEALVRRRRVHLRYLTRTRGTVSERDVSPQRLVHHRSTWYLDGYCHTRERLLRFALDAIEDASSLDDKALELPLKQVEAEMDAGYGIYAGGRRLWATLVFDTQAAQWVSREQWHAEQKGRWLEDGRYELTVPYTEETEIVMDILRHGDQVVVAAPASLAKAVKAKLAAAARRYGR